MADQLFPLLFLVGEEPFPPDLLVGSPQALGLVLGMGKARVRSGQWKSIRFLTTHNQLSRIRNDSDQIRQNDLA